MNVWARRLAYFILAIIWLLVMAFPVLAFVLATQGEIRVGQERMSRQGRLFLVQERDHEGLGLEWTTPTSDTCFEGRLIYLMWRGEGENTQYCTCVDQSGSVISSAPGACSRP